MRLIRPFGVLMALLAVLARLALPGPAPAGAADLTALAALGPHALCLAAASTNPTSAPAPQKPAPAEHSDHDGLGCCPGYGSAAFLLPRPAPAIRVAFAEQVQLGVARPNRVASRHLSRSFPARGPPAEA